MFSKAFKSVISFFRPAFYGLFLIVDYCFPRRKGKLVVFSYHSISQDGWRFSIDPERFRSQMEELLVEYQPISLSEAALFLKGKKLIDRPSFVITFDDGYRDILGVKEFLASKGIRPAFFVLSDPDHADSDEIGTRREFLSRDEVRSLVDCGWELGCHSATHGDFWSMSPDRILSETRGAKESLERELGVSVRFFAYPRGRYTDEAKRCIEESGYELALSMDDGFLCSKTDLFAVPRIGVDRTHSPGEFRSIHADASIWFRKFAKRFIGKLL